PRAVGSTLIADGNCADESKQTAGPALRDWSTAAFDCESQWRKSSNVVHRLPRRRRGCRLRSESRQVVSANRGKRRSQNSSAFQPTARHVYWRPQSRPCSTPTKLELRSLERCCASGHFAELRSMTHHEAAESGSNLRQMACTVPPETIQEP